MSRRLVKYDFDPFKEVGIKVKPAEKKELLPDVADLIREKLLESISESVSPVTGRSFPKLDKEYAKREHRGNRNARLDLNGDLLDSLEVRVIDGNKLRITVDDSEQDKADGHNNFSGQSPLPRRPFIPDAAKGETLAKSIRKDIKEFISESIDGVD